MLLKQKKCVLKWFFVFWFCIFQERRKNVENSSIISHSCCTTAFHFSLTHTHSHPFSLTHILSLTHTLTHSHTHPHSLSLTHTLTLFLSLFLSIYLYLSPLLTLSLIYLFATRSLLAAAWSWKSISFGFNSSSIRGKFNGTLTGFGIWLSFNKNKQKIVSYLNDKFVPHF
jgi:hypothetical protein